MKSGRDPLLIVLHGLKTGGTTLRSIVARQYPADSILTVPGRPTRLPATPGLQDPSTRVVQGHFLFGLHAQVDRPATYVTLLRDPIDRIISLYYFALENPTREVHEDFKPHLTSLEAFVAEGQYEEVDNGLTRRLSGEWPAYGQCTSELLELAKRNLREHFAVVGITERFDSSVLLMRRAFGWRDPFYVREKVTRSRPARDAVSGATVRLIQDRNELDAELYQYALELHDIAVRDQGLDFQDHLRVFGSLNGELHNRKPLRKQHAGRGSDPLMMLLDAHSACLRLHGIAGGASRRINGLPTKRHTRLRRVAGRLPTQLAVVLLIAAAALLLFVGAALGMALD